MDCRVVVEAAVPVYDVETTDEAVRIAIAKTGEMLNPDLNYVEISMGDRVSPGGEDLPPAFVAADEALVALELEMTVFNVEGEQHASRIARKEIGERLENIPLKVLEVTAVGEADESGEAEEADGADEADGGDESGERDEGTGSGTGEDSADGGRDGGGDASEEDLLPEFEEMVEDDR